MKAAASAMKAVNFPATPSIVIAPRTIQPTKPTFLSLHSPANLSKCSSLVSFPRCSAKPNTDNGETGQDSTFAFKPEYPSSLPPPTSSSSPSSSPSSLMRGLVLDLGVSADSWDSEEIGSPVVKRFLGDEEERWYMWYRGSSKQNPASDSTGLAISSNGIHWERGKFKVESNGDAGLVMHCCEDWWAFDTESVRPGEVVIMSSAKIRANSAVYWLYYTGYTSERLELPSVSSGLRNPERFNICDDKEGEARVFRSLPGLAISQDGRHWARIEGEHHSGALFDVGSEKDWDFLFIASPHVVVHRNGDLRMYYHSFDAKNGEFCIGIARSRDGIKWVKLGKIIGGRKLEKEQSFCFDEFGGINPCVTRNKRYGNYVMAYEGVDRNGKRSIGLAVSEDGLKDWKRLQDKAVLSPAMAVADGGAWDSEGVGSPCLVQMDGDSDHQWRLYYRGVGSGGRTGIGMAVSEGSDMTRFRRWTGFHL